MNIFFLSYDPVESAIGQYDKHVVKMPLESAQMLCTAHRLLDGVEYIDDSSGRKIKRWKLPDDREHTFYKATHVNHPSNIWTRLTSENYAWLYQHFVALCEEYTKRYGKTHKCERDLRDALKNPPNNIQEGDFQDVPQAMPDHYKSDNTVQAYRNYYLGDKISEGVVYTSTRPPDWVESNANTVLSKTIDQTNKIKWKF